MAMENISFLMAVGRMLCKFFRYAVYDFTFHISNKKKKRKYKLNIMTRRKWIQTFKNRIPIYIWKAYHVFVHFGNMKLHDCLPLPMGFYQGCYPGCFVSRCFCFHTDLKGMLRYWGWPSVYHLLSICFQKRASKCGITIYSPQLA